MNHVEIQSVVNSNNLPGLDRIQAWLDAALEDFPNDTEIVIRIVDEQESAALNQQYRHKNGPTNVLSFPYDFPAEVNLDLLGDLVVCAPVVEKEAHEQGKRLTDHWAHMIVHGVLHLIGYDHIEPAEAEAMEALEVNILQKFNISNPYLQVRET